MFPWTWFTPAPVVPPEGDGMADFYLNFPHFYTNNTITVVDRDDIGYNKGDKLIYVQRFIASSGIFSLEKVGGTVDYQNLTGADVYVILTVEAGNPNESAAFRVYSAPTTNSVSGATEVFDSADHAGNFGDGGDQLTTNIFIISNNHFIVLENLATTRGITVNAPARNDPHPFGVVIEPA